MGDTLYYDMVCYKVLTDSTVEVSRGYESGVPFGDTLVIPETITPGSQSFRVVALGSSAFNSYANPKVLVLPSSIKTIKHQCFYASRVTDPGLPEGLERIEYEAFFAAPYLQKLYLPASLSYVGHAAFAAASRLDSIFVEESNAHFCSVDGVLYSKDT
ncbi:MAG: leucine-rich repeat protein, partial [Bacteroidales bacterium]|nr:leucine-rich repeat protein [Bacteroidales bacterium]